MAKVNFSDLPEDVQGALFKAIYGVNTEWVVIRLQKNPGRKILLCRKKKNWTQQQLAEKAEVEEHEVITVENNFRQAKFESVLKIVNALGISIDDILYDRT